MYHLIDRDGHLHLPMSKPDHWGDTTRLLMIHYFAGDHDSVPWPFVDSLFATADELVYRLSCALYDEVQTGGITEHGDILLPDGRVFATFTGGPWGLLIDNAFKPHLMRWKQSEKALEAAQRAEERESCEY